MAPADEAKRILAFDKATVDHRADQEEGSHCKTIETTEMSTSSSETVSIKNRTYSLILTNGQKHTDKSHKLTGYDVFSDVVLFLKQKKSKKHCCFQQQRVSDSTKLFL